MSRCHGLEPGTVDGSGGSPVVDNSKPKAKRNPALRAKPDSRASVAGNVDDVMVDTKWLRARYGGRSAMWVWRLQRSDPTFPPPAAYINGRRFYWLSALMAWEARKTNPPQTPPAKPNKKARG